MKKYKLSELIKIKNGNDYRMLDKGDIPVYGTGGIITHVDSWLFEGESVLLPRKGSLSNILYVKEKFWTVDTMYWTEVKSEIVYPKYLYYYLILLDLSSRDSGSTLPSMTFDAYYELEVELPTKEEQKKVLDILVPIEDKIKVNTKINDNLEHQAKLLYDYWFTQFDFPDESGNPYRSSGGKMVWNEQLKRNIPENWKIVPLSNIFNFKSGFSFSSDLYVTEGRYKLLTIKNVQDNGITLEVDNYINDVPSNVPDYCFLKTNDILMSLTGNVGRVGIMYDNNFLLNQRVALAKPINKDLNSFVYFLLKSDFIRKQYATLANGSSQKNLSPIEAESVLIAFNEPIANKFASVINSYLKIVISNLAENEKLIQMRNWLLPMLMNGQVTIKN